MLTFSLYLRKMKANSSHQAICFHGWTGCLTSLDQETCGSVRVSRCVNKLNPLSIFFQQCEFPVVCRGSLVLFFIILGVGGYQ